MPRTTEAPRTPPAVDETWVMIRLRVPPAWKRWLAEAAEARATTVSAIVRQLIRELMLERPR